jgi:hypothetical protein
VLLKGAKAANWKLFHSITSCKGLDEETAREMMVSYVTGSSSPTERTEFEIHCLACSECCFTLAVVRRLLHQPADDAEEKALAPLFILGIEAAREARDIVLSKRSVFRT